LEDTLGSLTFLFYSGKGPIDRVIRWRTRSPYSHVAVLVGADVLYEATVVGWVRRTGQEASDHARAAALAIPTTPELDDLERAVRWAEARVGPGYGYESDLALALNLVVSRPGVFVCSTGAAEMGVRACVLDDVDERAETPGSLAMALQAQSSRTGP
jgi:hypothetical protein